MKNEAARFFAKQAWVQGSWTSNVLLEVGQDGCWSHVQAQTAVQQQQGATHLNGAVLPGLVNAHSHAFQRAIAGLTERRGAGAQASDDFWSCLLYTSDAADDLLCVDLGGRRIIKKKKNNIHSIYQRTTTTISH